MHRHFLTSILFGFLLITGCDRDKEPPSVLISEPGFDGMDVQFGDVFFVEFEVTDDRSDGGIWRVELRASDGVTVRTAQAGLWEDATTGRLITAFALDAAYWPTSEMTLAVVADDAAGNRAAAFRDFDYTAAADIPSTFAILTDEADGTSSITRISAEGESLGTWTGLPEAHQFAFANGVLALADASAATVHLLDWSNGDDAGVWTDATTSGEEPLIRSIQPLGIQAGFIVAHAGGIVAIDPSGALLFERFTEAPWTPVDVTFEGTTCIAWEQNPATGNHRVRSWDFQTGATGPIVNLAAVPAGWGAVGMQSSATSGNLALLSESNGLTLCATESGALNDLCGLLGEGAMLAGPKHSAGLGGDKVVYARESDVCVQSIGPVTSGSVWPVPGTIERMRSANDEAVELLVSDETGRTMWRWIAADLAPELAINGLPMNTVDVLLVNE